MQSERGARALLLASGSPRRRQLLSAAGIPLLGVRAPAIAEERAPGESPVAYARRLAREKAAAVAHNGPEAWVLAADTVVHIGDAVFEKPVDAADATRILNALSGGWHRVTTAWCLRWGGASPPRPPLVRHTTTRVRFRALCPAEIARYVASGEGMDKAGSYGIQELGVMMIEAVRGNFTNVVGLPMAPVLAALAEVGVVPEAP